ncbi:serine/threonine-protein phosphatase 7 [Hordeum vulgare]|nr:serine/threonine-protein phosphatase 7 [Hordeum vulgare]
MSPPEPEATDGRKKDRVLAGAPFTWIASNFANCPEDANEDVIQTYARVYMWYVFSSTICADGSGKNAQCMWLKALKVFDHKFSWGSTALTYLYRQLDEACRRSTRDGGIGGCMLLLSDVVSEVMSDVNILYKQYTNEMDSLTAEQRFGSSHRNTLDDSSKSGARMDDGDITLGAHLEDDVVSPEVEDDMTLEAFQRSTYLLKPQRGIKRYTPKDYANKGKKSVFEVSRMTEDVIRMRDTDDDDELEEPQPDVRKKLPTKRGRGNRTRGTK